MRRPLVLGVVFAAAIVALVSIAIVRSLGSAGDPAQLAALEADPLARYAPPGARLIRRRAIEESEALGKTACQTPELRRRACGRS